MRLYREIHDQGFAGKYRIVKNSFEKPDLRSKFLAVYRYETKPDVQGQVDWAECGKIEIDGEIESSTA